MVQETCTKQVPYTVCEYVPQECVKQVPVTICRMVQETCTKTVPYTVCTTEARTVQPVRAGERDQDVHQDRVPPGPVHGHQIRARAPASSRCPTPSPGWSARRACKQVPCTVTRMVPQTCVKRVPITTCRMVTEQRVKQVPVTTCRMVSETRSCQVPVTTCRTVAEPCVKKVCQTVCEMVTEPVRQDRARRRSARCRRSSASARCRTPPASQVVEPKTIMCPVTVQKQVTETKTICVPRTVCKQVPVEVCVKVPVVVHCEPAVLPSSQSVVASAQSQLPITTVPPCDPCDAKHPLFGRRLGLLHH